LSLKRTPDAQPLEPLLDSVPPVRSRRGRRQRPGKLHADKSYDQRALRAEVRRRGITVRIASKGIESSQRLGWHRVDRRVLPVLAAQQPLLGQP
jgi:hypothetical protein